MADGGQQRAFAKNLKQHTALQIRQSATASIKAVSERARPKLSVVEPLDYEGELITRRKDLENEQFLNLILFPQQDVVVEDEEWDLRTVVPPVDPDVVKEAPSLFTHECLKFYSSKWHKVKYNYMQYSYGFNSRSHHGLREETFELDLVAEERYNSLSADKSGGTPLTKKGYLHKGPFPQDGGISVSMKNYRKRWFSLSGGPREGGYTLTFYKDEKSNNIKGKIDLDTCTEVKKNTRYRSFGFDLVTDDERIFYPLSTEGEEDLEDWISILNRAIHMEVEETDVGMGTLSSFYTKETMKEVKRFDIHPEMLEYTATTDAMNAKMREKDRHVLLSVYPELSECPMPMDQGRPQAAMPEEKFGFRFLLSCKNLSFKLKVEQNGNTDHIEPFFLTFALYDVNKGVKISENFHVDPNSAFLRQMVPPPEGHTDNGPHPLCLKATRATEGVFSVTFPHNEVYLVAKVDKILQGGITACAEPYMKDFDNPKVTQKMSVQSNLVTERLGQYRMPFAWAARPLFTTTPELDIRAEFSPLFKQEKEKLGDEDIVKLLSNFRTLHKQKLQVIPGELNVEVTPLSHRPIAHDILNCSYVPLKPSHQAMLRRGSDLVDEVSHSKMPPVLEVREFPPLDAYHPHTSYQPNAAFVHHLYVYPLSLKYDGQKSFPKARNISCCIQFKDSDEINAPALSVIYCKSAGAAFTDQTHTAILHHCTSPAFYEEVKIKLPVKINSSHHLLFTFYHISCDVQRTKSSKGSIKQAPLETLIGYAWQPLMDSTGQLLGDIHSLPVAVSLLPGYLAMAPLTNGHGGTLTRTGGASSPELKWVDGHKPLFRVHTKFDTTIYSLDPQLHQFFLDCQRLHANSSPPSMAQILSAVKALGDMNMAATIQFLPLVLTQLFKLLSHSSKEVENIKPDVLRLLLSLVDSIVRAEGTGTLHSYIEYMFMTEVDSSRKKGVHDELARLLVQYLRQQTSDEEHIPRLLDHLWFFLEIMLKSMAQYLVITKKVSASRKTRYPEDFGWNLQNMVIIILTHIREKHTVLSAKKANTSLADFIKRTFSFIDRGVVFKIISRYLDAFNIKENFHLSSLKLEFIRIICNHEHFVPLNLPFPVASENMEYGLSDEFCRRHFLVGILLREVESALEYEAGPVRAKTLKVLRNLLAKHDTDTRYTDVGQRGRVASLYFPLIPLILNHVSRLDMGSDSYVSPMLNAASMAAFKSAETNSIFSTSESMPGSTSGTLKTEKNSTLERVRNGGLAKITTGHRRKSSEMSFDPTEVALSSDAASALLFCGSFGLGGSGMDEVAMEMDKLGVEETRDLLVSALFVLKHLDTRVLHHWWQECMGSSNTSTLLFSEEVHTSQFSQLMDFFDLLESCIYAFRYEGHASIARAVQSSHEQEQQNSSLSAPPSSGKDKAGKKSSGGSISSPMGSLQTAKAKAVARSTLSSVSSPSSSLLSSAIPLPVTLSEATKAEVNAKVKVQGALANEVGLVVLTLLDNFSTSFRRELCQDEGDNIVMTKYFSLLVAFLQVNQSVTLQTHVFALLRSFIYKYREPLFRGSADYCGILCYEILQCCNSRVQSTRTEATILLYLLMRYNFEYFKGKSFVRTNLQATIAVSKLVSTLIGQSDANLRRSLSTIASYVSQDERVKSTNFPAEVNDLMNRLKTVLSSTAQMEIHKSDHEKLVDLHYSLAKSYGQSPELRQTWLDSMTALHLKYGNYSEAAQCCIHIAGLVAEYLKIKKIYPAGCQFFSRLSRNVALEEGSIKSDLEESGDEQTFSERNLVALLETSIKYLHQAERYEMMAEAYKLLQPFYEKSRDFKHMMEMYGKLHEAFVKVVDISTTGRRYLGTYFRIAFYGKPFGEDNSMQYIYKEPKVTALAELTLRLQKLYSRTFGSKEIVHIIPESGKVNVSALLPDHAYIQITHVEPYFTASELEERKTKFERENNLSRFVFETPFTTGGKGHGDVTKQCMRKTILTTSHWFPYVKKRIPVIDQEQFDLTAIQVAIEAIDKKTRDMASVVKLEPPDLKRLQLLLAGSISTQVNQGVQEYVAFFKDPANIPAEHVDQLMEMYRTFMQVCQEALELNGRLISTDQLLYHDDLKTKFQEMEEKLAPFQGSETSRTKSPPLHSDGYSTSSSSRRRGTRVDPHRMSAILFHSISSSK